MVFGTITGRQTVRVAVLLTVATITLAAMPARVALGAEVSASEDTALDEIVVTARRVEERLQDVPISVSAFSAQALQDRGVSDLSGLTSFVPNLTFRAGGNTSSATNAQVFIRGVGQSDFLPTADPGVGIYVDGVYLGRSVGSLLKLEDLSQVEVLRGPQGTLFGRNTIGGAINIRTPDPAFDSLHAYGQGDYGNYDLRDISAGISAPVNDSLAMRLDVIWRARDGYGHSSSVPIDFGNEHYTGARAKAIWAVTADINVTFSGDYFRQRQNNGPETSYAAACADGSFRICPVDPATGLPAFSPASLLTLYNAFLGTAPGGTPVTNAQFGTRTNPFWSTATGPSRDDQTVAGGSVVIDIRLNDVWGLKSITAYRHMNAQFGSDNDALLADVASTTDTFFQHQLSEELQLSFKSARLRGLLGAYFLTETASDVDPAMITPGLYNALENLPVLLPSGPGAPVPCALAPFAPIPGTPFRAAPAGYGPGCLRNIANARLDNQVLVDQRVRTDSYALFGQGTYALSDAWSGTLGLRLTDDRKTYDYFQERTAVSEALGAPFYSVAPTNRRRSWVSVTPRVDLDYKPDPNHVLYASYSRGFKSGTFNGRASSAEGVSPVAPELIDELELGSKNVFADGHARLNADFFYSRYKQIQLLSVVSDPLEGLLFNLVNAGHANVYGAEAELSVLPVPRLSLDLTAGYTHSDIGGVSAADAAATGVRNGNRLPQTPESTFSASAEYRFDLNVGTLAPRLSYAWQDRQYFDAANNPETVEASYGLLDAQMALESVNKRWRWVAYGNDLTNKVYFNSLFRSGGGQAVAYPAPARQYGFKVRYSF